MDVVTLSVAKGLMLLSTGLPARQGGRDLEGLESVALLIVPSYVAFQTSAVI